MEPLPDLDWLPADHLSYAWSAFTVYGLWALVPLSALVLLVDRWYVHHSQTKALEAQRPAKALRPGKLAVRGVVRAEGTEPPIVLCIRQDGTEHPHKGKGQHTHRWTEVDRSLYARPFQLELEGGELVDVIADPARLRLYAELDEGRYAGQDRRVRTASVGSGDTVTLIGLVKPGRSGGVYRGAARATLTAPPRGHLIVSAIPLGAPTARWRRFYGRCALLLVAAVALAHPLAFGSYHALALRGVAQQAEVFNYRTYQTKQKSGYVDHYEISAYRRGPHHSQEPTLTAETSSSGYQLAPSKPTAPFIIDREDPANYQIGQRPHVDVLALVVGCVAIVASAALFVFYWRRYGAWYERKRYVNEGRGRLVQADP